jgi:hypothetical protein
MTVIEVAIGPGGAPGVFAVEVVASPAGEAKTTVELDADALLARHGLLQQAVLASAVPSRRVLPETERPVREVGELLFAGLLGAGELAGRYRAAAAVAAERGEGLRVVLRIDSPALAGLPWEAMYDQAAGAYVCRQDQLVRHVPVASVPAPLRVRPPLRILGVVSSPRGLPLLDAEKEQEQLARALARPADQGLAKLHWAPTATWTDLQDLLLEGEWHVLHFIGHGDFDPGRDEGMLALEREDGSADLVAAHRMVDLLRQARPMPRLVVLNSCSGAATGASDLFSGTAAALVRGGIRAVAAMQYEISDPAAVAFARGFYSAIARGFYSAIARGRGVDDAVSSGRVAILGLSDRTLEWVTPVLYLRGRDAHLFTFPAPAEDRDREGTGSIRGGQPGDTVSPGAAGGGPRGDSPGPAALPQLASVLTDALSAARSITEKDRKATVLVVIAEAVAATDPDRAALLTADAERIAQLMTEEGSKALALVRITESVAATDPDRAEGIARSITNEERREFALSRVAPAFAAADPDRAESIARSISYDFKVSALARVAEAVAATDPGRAARLIVLAERIAQSITEEVSKAGAPADVAAAVVATDPDRAESIAQSITDEYSKVLALARIAAAVAAAAPGRAARLTADAEGIAQSIIDGRMKALALARVAGAVIAVKPVAYQAVGAP